MLLRQLRNETESAIYLSADTLERGESLAGIIRTLRDGYRIRNFFLDEIHFADRFTAALKEIYDFYDVRVWFTSSSALALHDSSWDLSRRVIRFHLRAGGALRDYLSGGLHPFTLEAPSSPQLFGNMLGKVVTVNWDVAIKLECGQGGHRAGSATKRENSRLPRR